MKELWFVENCLLTLYSFFTAMDSLHNKHESLVLVAEGKMNDSRCQLDVSLDRAIFTQLVGMLLFVICAGSKFRIFGGKKS